MSTFWDFTANTTSVIKTLRDADPPREQTFIALSLKMVDNLIYLYDAGVYSSAIAFEQIGDIDGVAPTDLQDAFDKILAIIPASGGGGSQDLQSVTDLGNTITDGTSTLTLLTSEIDLADGTNSLVIGVDAISLDDGASIATIQAGNIAVADATNSTKINKATGIELNQNAGSKKSYIRNTNGTTDGQIYELPNKAAGSYTLATTEDITGSGTVSTVSVVTANGVTGSVANATTTPAITLSLGAITPTTVVASGNVSGANLSGTNTGDNSANTNSNAYADAKVTDAIVDGVTAIAPSQNAVFDALALKAPLASPALTGNPTAPTQTANDNSTKIANTAYVDASALLRKDLVLPGKTIVVFGDSYSTGVGATNTGRGYINILKDGIGCGISNNAVQGTTIMKRTPVNYISSPNMVDNATNIPTYSEATHGLLLFEFGLNDMGQNGANYTTANFIADYQTVLTYANGTKGWPFNKILILGAPYANSTGYAAYAVLSGNAAPTTQHHLDFIEAARQVAQTNQTMFIDLYAAQVKNGVSTTMNADGYHPNDAGHFAIAKIIGNYLGYTGIFESRVPVSSSTPSKVVSGGASYSVTLGEQANMVAVFYNDGVNIAGIGESSNTQEYHIYSGGKHNFYINNVLIHSLKTTGPETTLVSTTGGLKVGYVAKTANYTIGTNDHTINCTANSFTVTLPSAVTVGSGKIYCINNAGSGTITVATTSSQTIDGTTPGTLTQNHNITVMSDGANWIILSQK